MPAWCRNLVMTVGLLSSCVRQPPRAADPAAEPLRRCATASLASASDVVSGLELRRAAEWNVYDALLRRRPVFLARLATEAALSAVVVAERRVLGPLAALRGVGAGDVVCVRRLTAAEVYRLTGLTAPAGVEVIRLP
jgi:hypothetical protein